MGNPWNDPRILSAAVAMAHRIQAGDPDPAIDADDLDDSERALAHYLGRTMVKLSQLVQNEILCARLLGHE
jgi:hypothetical protein